MSNATIIFLLTICIVILVCIIVYQQFVFHNGTKAKIHEISSKLKELLDTGSDEKVTVFTDNRALIELATQINRMLEDRQKVKVEYRRTEMASKKMLSNISHDIKTPMTVILGYLEIMRLNGTQSNEMLQKIESTARRVMGLITQFFTLAKLEAGDIDMPLERLNANEACRENILDFYELLSQKDFQVELDIPDQALYANANKDALQRIMFNLISNAIRYGGDGKYLGMFLRADQAHIYIDIVDRGRGIEKEFAASVFDRLFTMEDSRNSAMQGNGLGLTIAKNLALQLGGDITLESHPHQKTVFTITLKKMAYKNIGHFFKKEICKNYSRVLKIELSIMSVERRAKQCHLFYKQTGLLKRSVVRHLSLMLIFISPKGKFMVFSVLTELVKPR